MNKIIGNQQQQKIDQNLLNKSERSNLNWLNQVKNLNKNLLFKLNNKKIPLNSSKNKRSKKYKKFVIRQNNKSTK